MSVAIHEFDLVFGIFRNGKNFTVFMVKTFGDVAGEFDVLELIFPDWHIIGTIKQNIGGHENWIIENPDVGGKIAVMTLVLILSHAESFTHGSVAIQNPSEFGVGWYVRLAIKMHIFV